MLIALAWAICANIAAFYQNNILAGCFIFNCLLMLFVALMEEKTTK